MSCHASCSSNRKMCIILASFSFFLAILDTHPSTWSCLTVNLHFLAIAGRTNLHVTNLCRHFKEYSMILKIYRGMNVAVSRMKIYCNKSQVTTALKANKNLNRILLNNEWLKIWKIFSSILLLKNIYFFCYTHTHSHVFFCFLFRI